MLAHDWHMMVSQTHMRHACIRSTRTYARWGCTYYPRCSGTSTSCFAPRLRHRSWGGQCIVRGKWSCCFFLKTWQYDVLNPDSHQCRDSDPESLATLALQSADFGMFVNKIMHRVCAFDWTALFIPTPEEVAKDRMWAPARPNVQKRHMCVGEWGDPESS